MASNDPPGPDDPLTPPRVGLRLPRETRMRQARDFRLTYAEGARARGSTLILVVRLNGLDVTRYGLSVGKRCWKHAVRRNRVRRIFREAFRLSRHELTAGLDIVMIPAVPRLAPELGETRRELVELTGRALRKLERRATDQGAT